MQASCSAGAGRRVYSGWVSRGCVFVARGKNPAGDEMKCRIWYKSQILAYSTLPLGRAVSYLPGSPLLSSWVKWN